MPSCAAFGCNNHSSGIKRKYVSFHGFPLKNEKLLKTWLIQMRRKDFVPTVSSKLCSEHFEENCFDYQNFTNRRIIKSDAVPTIFSFRKCGWDKRNEYTTIKRRKYSELKLGFHPKAENDTDDPDGAAPNSDAVLTEGKPPQDSNHPDYVPNIFVDKPAANENERSREEIHENDVNNTANNLVGMDVSWEPICEIKEGKPSQDSNHSNYVPNIHEKNVSDTAHNLVEMDVNWEPICQIDEEKTSQNFNDPDYVPTIIVCTPATDEKKRSRDEICEKNISSTANNLVEMDVNLETTCQIQKEIPAVENIIVKEEIEIEDGANTSASKKMKEISAIKIVHAKQEAEHENNEIITVAEQIKESLLNDELQQTKIELQQANARMNTLVAEKNKLMQKLDAAILTQDALFTTNSKQNEELQVVKLNLQMAYFDKNNLIAENNELMRAVDDCKATNNSLKTPISLKECDIYKVKKDLKQAYSDINALRKEKEELVKKVPASDLPQSILQSEKKLYFYTGLNSAKDFHAVLSLLSPDQSGTKILPFDAQVLIVLIKIKWNFRNIDLAYRFNISMISVQRMCSTLIPILKNKLELIVNGPINKALKKNIPQGFKNSVYENLYQRIQMENFLKPRKKEDESYEPDMEEM